MASGTLYGSGNNLQCRITWSSSPNSVSNNSYVTARLQVRMTSISTEITQPLIWDLQAYNSNGTRIKGNNGSGRLIISGSWTTYGTISFTVSHFSSGSKYIYLYGLIQNSSIGTSSVVDSVRINLDTIVRGVALTTAPNFTDEENPTIVFSNKSGTSTISAQACISLTGETDDIAYRDINLSESSFTFELTDEERELLRNATLEGSTSRKVIFKVKSEVSGVSTPYFREIEKTFTVVNCMPEIYATFYDVNEKAIALTGNSDIFILGASDLQFQVEATPKKGATISGYNTICGAKSSTLQQSVFYQVEANEITFTATDNRGQLATLTLPFETIEYLRPTCEVEVGELTIDEAGGSTASAPVKISGQFFNSTFGADGVTNAIDIEIKHSGTNDEWDMLTDELTPTIEGNNYYLNITARGLDYTKQLTFQARLIDKASSVESVEKSVRLIPVFDWGENDFNFNVPVNFNQGFTVGGGGSSMFDYIVEQGTSEMGTDGTWHWSKWSSGKAECYGVRNFGSLSASQPWGYLYEAGPFTQDFPTGLFIEAPEVVNMDIQRTSSGAFLEISGNDISASKTGNFYVVRATSRTLEDVHISFHCIGRWK